MYSDDDYDYEELRRLIIDYYGTGSSFYPQTIMKVEEARRASNKKILEMASEIGIDVKDYREQER